MGDLWAELNQEMVSKLRKYKGTTVNTFHYVILLTLGLCSYFPSMNHSTVVLIEKNHVVGNAKIWEESNQNLYTAGYLTDPKAMFFCVTQSNCFFKKYESRKLSL